jgi:RNA polymerase sigma factor (TIGR02999 family)
VIVLIDFLLIENAGTVDYAGIEPQKVGSISTIPFLFGDVSPYCRNHNKICERYLPKTGIIAPIQNPGFRSHMTAPSPEEVSTLLRAWGSGDREAFDKLVPLVHHELHRIAHRYMARESIKGTLQTTALINEAYLRLIGVRKVQWQDRAHFLAISANVMRCILVDFARARRNKKHGGDIKQLTLKEALLMSSAPDPDLVKLDDALTALTELYPRKARVVELRFFGGLDLDETAKVLKVSRDTVKSDWRFAKAWLLREMRDRGNHETE